MRQRKSPRAGWLEYNDGEYFVTVCTHEHTHYLGEITNGVMTMTKMGRYLDNELKNATLRHPHIEIVQYVVMPNHFHAIINIVGTRRAVSARTCNTDTARRVPTTDERMEKGIGIQRLPLLSTFIGSLKSAVTRYAHANGIPFAWQSRYHDHAMRNNEDRNNISQYIENNVANWEKDCFY